MKKLFFVFAVIAFSAQAQDKNYISVGYGQAAYEAYGGRWVPTILRLTAGTNLMDNLAIEGMLATGIRKSNVSGIGVEVQNMVGLYAKPFIKMNENFEAYGRVGMLRTTLDASASGVSTSETESSFSYGAGIQFNPDSRGGIFLDYMNYYSKDGQKIFGFNSGVNIKF